MFQKKLIVMLFSTFLLLLAQQNILESHLPS